MVQKIIMHQEQPQKQVRIQIVYMEEIKINTPYMRNIDYVLIVEIQLIVIFVNLVILDKNI